ncbi:unnamed protein product, partial [Mesorhabditis spiculigera]
MLALALFIFQLIPIYAIKCVRQQGLIESKRVDNYTIGSCRGDLCYYFKSEEDVMDRDCLSGFSYPVGCQTYPGKGTLCICDSNNCNRGSIDRNFTMAPVWCNVYNEIYNHHFHSHSIVTAISRRNFPICTVNGELMVNGDEEISTLKLWAGTPDPHFSYHTDATPIQAGDQADLLWSFTYEGGLYALQKDPGVVSLFARCTSDYCNHFTFSDVERKGPKCVLPGGQECEGTFCVYATGEVDVVQKLTTMIDGVEEQIHALVGQQTRSAQYCLSQNADNAAFAITAGVYKFRRITYYVCDEENCNFDEATARLATENCTNTFQRAAPRREVLPKRRPSYPPQPTILGDGNWTVPTSGYVDGDENRRSNPKSGGASVRLQMTVFT